MLNGTKEWHAKTENELPLMTNKIQNLIPEVKNMGEYELQNAIF